MKVLLVSNFTDQISFQLTGTIFDEFLKIKFPISFSLKRESRLTLYNKQSMTVNARDNKQNILEL